MRTRSKNSPTTSKSRERQLVELDRKRVPVKKFFHGQEIRAAAKNLEDFRLNYKEEEILLGAKIHLELDSFTGELNAIVTRLETDKEYETRQEILRAAAEAKAERDRKRAEAAARKAAKEAQERERMAELERKKNLEDLKVIVAKMQLTDKEIVDILGA